MHTQTDEERKREAAELEAKQREREISDAAAALTLSNNPFGKAPAPFAKEKTPAPVVRETIHADDKEWQEIIKAYKDRYNKDQYKWYKEPEKNKDGHFTLYFEDENTATEFSKAQAKAGHKFIMIDEKGKVKGYSDGENFLENTENKSLEDIGRELGWQNNGPRMR